MIRLVWTRPALEDVQEIRAYIARDSQRYARIVAERLVAAVERLPDHPLSGRVVPEVGQSTLREVIEPPYRIVYRVRAELLEVLAVVHSARQFPSEELR
ncbi:MAG: type II toxin-antitoxin system RelE/ParE family toxin [Gemmatimonadota bacterium]